MSHNMAQTKVQKEKEAAVAKQEAADAKAVADAKRAGEKVVSDREKQEADELKASQSSDSKAQKQAEKDLKKSGMVYGPTGVFVREYTEEHSDDDRDYVEKALIYAKKIGGEVR